MLEKNPDQRYASCSKVAEDLAFVKNCDSRKPTDQSPDPNAGRNGKTRVPIKQLILRKNLVLMLGVLAFVVTTSGIAVVANRNKLPLDAPHLVPVMIKTAPAKRSKIRSLSLQSTHLDRKDLELICQLHSLKTLNLRYNFHSRSDALAVTKALSQHLPNLERLCLQGENVNRECTGYLKQLKKLKLLVLADRRAPAPELLEEFNRALPHCLVILFPEGPIMSDWFDPRCENPAF